MSALIEMEEIEATEYGQAGAHRIEVDAVREEDGSASFTVTIDGRCFIDWQPAEPEEQRSLTEQARALVETTASQIGREAIVFQDGAPKWSRLVDWHDGEEPTDEELDEMRKQRVGDLRYRMGAER